jgi:hypothetical protein
MPSLIVKQFCKIKNENEILKYRNALKKWEADQRCLWEEFKIDDKELEKRIVN